MQKPDGILRYSRKSTRHAYRQNYTLPLNCNDALSQEPISCDAQSLFKDAAHHATHDTIDYPEGTERETFLSVAMDFSTDRCFFCMVRYLFFIAIQLSDGGLVPRCVAQQPRDGTWLDLRKAIVILSGDATARESKAVQMLVEEVHRRTSLHWPVGQWSEVPPGQAVILVGSKASLTSILEQRPMTLIGTSDGAEGYQVQVFPDIATVVVSGNDERGVLFGVGRLLRELRMERGQAALPSNFAEASAPEMPLRGHQLGYRPKTNSYDAWDVHHWEQYYRDLAVFGTNAIELIPPRSDDDADSPHFPRPPMEMMIEMSRLADEYGLDVWIWYPAMDEDYSKPETVEFALREWEEVYRHLPRINAIFVPGGDPGHTQPGTLLSFLEKPMRWN